MVTTACPPNEGKLKCCSLGIARSAIQSSRLVGARLRITAFRSVSNRGRRLALGSLCLSLQDGNMRESSEPT